MLPFAVLTVARLALGAHFHRRVDVTVAEGYPRETLSHEPVSMLPSATGSAVPPPTFSTLIVDESCLLTFRRPSAAVAVHWKHYLAFGLVFTWLAGHGRSGTIPTHGRGDAPGWALSRTCSWR